MIWRLAKSHLPNVQSVADQINFKPNKIWADRVLDLKGKTVCWPLKHKVDDIMLISKTFDEEERMISKNSMRWRPSSGLFSVIHSKLGGYTHWVHLWCTQWILNSREQNADLQSINPRQSTDFLWIKRRPMNNGRRKQQKIVFYRVTQSSEVVTRQAYFQGISC